MPSARLLPCLFLLTVLLVLPCRFFAQAPAEHTLTNTDIARMMKAGLPESIIVRDIRMSKTNFSTGPNELIELKNKGASEHILGAMLDSRNSGGMAMGGTLASTKKQSSPPGVHRLPNVQADLKIKSNPLAKVSMTGNHIKVEHGGKPLFDLKWKEKRDP